MYEDNTADVSSISASSSFALAFFNKSLIIHDEKTKEITTVKEVWICDPNYHKFG